MYCDVDSHIAVGCELVVQPLNVWRTDVPRWAWCTIKVTLVDVLLMIHANKCLTQLTHTNNKICYHTRFVRCAMTVEILSTAAELYEKMCCKIPATSVWTWKSLKIIGNDVIWQAMHHFLSVVCSNNYTVISFWRHYQFCSVQWLRMTLTNLSVLIWQLKLQVTYVFWFACGWQIYNS